MQPSHRIVTCPNYKNPLCFGVGKHEVHLTLWGDPTAPKQAICVHGLTRNARDFDFLARALVDHGYYVVAMDMVGRGYSPNLNKPKHYTYPVYVADVCHVMEELELEAVDYIGTSMGGLIGMMIATHKPNFIGRLVLNDIGPFIPKEALERLADYIGRPTEFASKGEAEADLRERMQSFGAFDEVMWQHVLEHAFVEAEGAWRYRYDPHIADAFWNKRGKMRKLEDMPLWQFWDGLEIPILVLRGAESDLLNKETFAKMEKKNNVTSITFDRVGHAPMLMSEEQIEPIVNWLL